MARIFAQAVADQMDCKRRLPYKLATVHTADASRRVTPVRQLTLNLARPISTITYL